MTTIDFSDDQRHFLDAKAYVTDCANQKRIRLPPNTSVVLERLKARFVQSDPTPTEVYNEISDALTAAGATPYDSRAFAACVRSMLDVYHGKVTEFIGRGFGLAPYGTGNDRLTLIRKALTPGANPNEWIWNGGFTQASHRSGSPLYGVAVVITAAIAVPEAIVIAVAVVALLVFVGGLPGGGGKTWVEQFCDTVADIFGW